MLVLIDIKDGFLFGLSKILKDWLIFRFPVLILRSNILGVKLLEGEINAAPAESFILNSLLLMGTL